MAISVTHAFISGKSDETDATLVRPSNWNAGHTITMATNNLLGRGTVGSGAVEEITLGTNLSLSGTTLNAVASSSTDALNHGRLEYVSITALSFKPYNGDKIKISGALYNIPSAGIATLANSGLSASTLYYVYAYNNAGTISGEFSATGHSVSATAGNVGTEIKTGDDSRTLIGMIRTNASGQFQSDAAFRGVISWFNRRNISLVGSLQDISSSSTVLIELGTTAKVFFLSWSDEAVSVACVGAVTVSVISNVILQLTFDGTSNVFPHAVFVNCATATGVAPMVWAWSQSVAEGWHYANAVGSTGTGTCNYTFSLTGTTRG